MFGIVGRNYIGSLVLWGVGRNYISSLVLLGGTILVVLYCWEELYL